MCCIEQTSKTQKSIKDENLRDKSITPRGRINTHIRPLLNTYLIDKKSRKMGRLASTARSPRSKSIHLRDLLGVRASGNLRGVLSEKKKLPFYISAQRCLNCESHKTCPCVCWTTRVVVRGLPRRSSGFPSIPFSYGKPSLPESPRFLSRLADPRHQPQHFPQ